MILAYWCVLIAAFMTVAFAGYAKFAGKNKMPPQANAHPRAWLEQAEGAQKRAHWAQLNSQEAFPPFAAGVIIAALAGASTTATNVLAVLFIIFRVIYGVCYIKNFATARSMVWGFAALCVVGLFIAAALG